MKKFVATFIYGDEKMKWSRIKGVEASSKAVAQKRAGLYAQTELRMWKQVQILVEELTPKKMADIDATFAELEAEMARLRSIKNALADCRSVNAGYRRI